MIKHIDVQALDLGMYVHRFDGAWMDHPFWREGFLVRTQDELARIRASQVPAVWIDTSRGAAPAGALPAQAAAVPQVQEGPVQAQVPREGAPAGQGSLAPTGPLPTGMAQELANAAALCRNARQAIAATFEQARLGLVGASDVARALVDEVTDSVTRHPGALVSLARLRTVDTDTYMHSVAVCALMVALARQLGLDDAQVRSAGLAGLLHDIGKARVPLSILNKPGPLTQEEFDVVRGHPAHGHRMLRAIGNVDVQAMDACLHHHEKMDGTGYPHRLRGEQIGLMARMTAICDVYDAVTSDRPYKKAWDPAHALQRMAQWSGGHFDGQLFQAFVRSVGIYPVGSLVRLTSDRLAVVVEQSRVLVAPRVKVFYSTRSQMRVAHEVLDLSAMRHEKILAREDPAAWGFPDLDALWSGLAAPP